MATILGSVFDTSADSSARITAIYAWSAEVATDGSVTFTCTFGPPADIKPVSTTPVGWGTAGPIPIQGPGGRSLTIDGEVSVTWGANPGGIFVATFTPRVFAPPFTAQVTIVEMVPTPGTFPGPVTPNLARVIAQAADSAFVTIPEFYVVCRWLNVNEKVSAADITLDPYNVQQPAATYDIALCMVDKLKAADPKHPYGIFGPFQNTGSGAGTPPATQLQVGSIQVTTNPASPTQWPAIEGTRYDAMFWSLEVVQKMVVPYYAEEYGPEFATNMMNEFTQAPVAVVMHLPWSEYTEMSVTGEPTSVGPTVDPTACGQDVGASAAAAPSAARRTRYRPGIPFLREDGTIGIRVLHPKK
jgi:hypothetical protein